MIKGKNKKGKKQRVKKKLLVKVYSCADNYKDIILDRTFFKNFTFTTVKNDKIIQMLNLIGENT